MSFPALCRPGSESKSPPEGSEWAYERGFAEDYARIFGGSGRTGFEVLRLIIRIAGNEAPPENAFDLKKGTARRD